MKSHLKTGMLYVLLLFVISMSAAFAQTDNTTDQSIKTRYETGKKLYQEGKYTEAIDIFRPLSRMSQGNPYTPYASFFFGLSALGKGDYDLAKNMFLQIKSKYPQWDQLGQIDYWLSNTYFQQKDYQQAIQLLHSMDQKSMADKTTREDAKSMKAYFLAKTESDSLLQSLLTKFPEDREIAEQIVENVSRSFYDTNKQLLRDSLVKKFNIDLAELGTVSKESSVKKKVYQVAVMLPFLYEKLNRDITRQGNQFVLDLYEGIRLASQDLQKEGIQIHLHAYDTRKSFEETKKLLTQEEMKNMDVIIGPLYQDPIKAVADFSKKNQIYAFNPLSSNPAVIGENPFSYLIKPSVITEAKVAAKLAMEKLNAKGALIITGVSSQDSLRKISFIENFEKDTTNKVEVVQIASFNRTSMDSLVSRMQRMEVNSVVYVASDDPLLISNVVSVLVMAHLDIPVIGNDKWLSISNISYEQIEDVQAYLIDPNFTDYDNEKLKDFTSRFRHNQYDLPDHYVLDGYDMMYFIGQMLNKYGIYFQEFFQEGKPVNSLFYAGYNYYKANDNQVIPIVRFENAQLVRVNEQED